MLPECLICLEKVKGKWTPPTLCECEIIIHEQCWTQWEKRAGPRCIICRKGPQLLLVVEEVPEQGIAQPCLKVASGLIVFFLTWMFLLLITPKPFIYTDRTWRRLQYDEL
jgi:hypothetical protein